MRSALIFHFTVLYIRPLILSPGNFLPAFLRVTKLFHEANWGHQFQIYTLPPKISFNITIENPDISIFNKLSLVASDYFSESKLCIPDLRI